LSCVGFFADKSEGHRNNARMNSPRTGLRVASVIFGIFAVGHLVRLINHAQVMVGTYTIPMGVSWIALIVAVILCIWFWRLSNLRGIA
jgi:Flp pilus assembly protein TadB